MANNYLQYADLDDFTRGYIEAAFFTESGDDESPLQDQTFGDLAPEALASMVADCKRFRESLRNANGEDILDVVYGAERTGAATDKYDYDSLESYAGHDFWLTRNGHGTGFWDGDWPEPYATQLDEAAKRFGNCDLYVGDDGKVYVS